MSPYILLGDSNTGIYANAIQTLGRSDMIGSPLGSARLFHTPFFVAEGAGFSFTPEIVRTNLRNFAKRHGDLDVSAAKGRLVLSLGLAAAPFFGSRMWQGRTFGAEPDPRKDFVSSAVIDAMILNAQTPIMDFLRFCHAQGLLAAALAGPPPQKRHRAVATLGRDRVFELERRFEQPVRDLLNELDCPIVTTENVSDDEGFLREDFYGSNWAHANDAFGILGLEALINRLGLPKPA